MHRPCSTTRQTKKFVSFLWKRVTGIVSICSVMRPYLQKSHISDDRLVRYNFLNDSSFGVWKKSTHHNFLHPSLTCHFALSLSIWHFLYTIKRFVVVVVVLSKITESVLDLKYDTNDCTEIYVIWRIELGVVIWAEIFWS